MTDEIQEYMLLIYEILHREEIILIGLFEPVWRKVAKTASLSIFLSLKEWENNFVRYYFSEEVSRKDKASAGQFIPVLV